MQILIGMKGERMATLADELAAASRGAGAGSGMAQVTIDATTNHGGKPVEIIINNDDMENSDNTANSVFVDMED